MNKRDRVPLALADQNLEQFYARDPRTGERVPDDEINSLTAAVRTARGQAEAVLALAKALASDPTRTREAGALEVRKAALKAAEKAAAALDAARARVDGAVKRIAAETRAPAAPIEATAVMMESEIRTALARMDDKGRTAAIGKAFAEDDTAVIGAVLRGPALLSGLAPAQYAGLEHRWRREKFPAEFERLERLGKALQALDRAGESFMAFVEDLSTTPEAQMAEHATRVTDEARAAIAE